MWLMSTLIIILLPIMMIIVGSIMMRSKPRNAKSKVYYCTERSMRNVDTRRYAHKICGGFYVWVGKRLLIVSPLISIIVRISMAKLIPLCGVWLLLETCCMLFAVPFTEIALKNKFHLA